MMEWWKNSVIYQLYPQSFLDTNGDGFGDIAGIRQKIAYLKSLGIDAVWLNPVYTSPMVDAGYDISDFRNVDPRYGSTQEFLDLIASLRQEGIRVMMDLVPSYTSNQHEWFLISSDTSHPEFNTYKDFFIWHPGRENNALPNNWQSFFGGPAWTWAPKRGAYYFHKYYKEMPLLNWRNPEVAQRMFGHIEFWLKAGIDGFRVDSITCLFVDELFRDNPAPVEGKSLVTYDYDLPECHDIIRDIRSLVNKFPGTVLLGETDCASIETLCRYFGKNNDGIHLPMNFMIAMQNKLSAPNFREKINPWDNNPAHGWPTYFLSNHDKGRFISRYGNGVDNDAIARLLSTMLFTLRGTSILYYGDEIGMADFYPPTIDQIVDPRGRTYWPEKRGRDGCRTPMQWDSGCNAGFTSGKPWLPMPSNASQVTVTAQDKDPGSLLNWYRSLIKIRKTHDAFVSGEQIQVLEANQHVLAYIRKSPKESCIVLLNMGKEDQRIALDNLCDTKTQKAAILLSHGAVVNGDKCILNAFASAILSLSL